MKFHLAVNQWIQIADPTDNTMFGYVTEKIKEKAKEELKAEFKETFYVFLDAVGETLMELVYAVTLLGGGILLILRVAGLRKGNKWASVLFCANALIHFLIGGIT